MNITSIGSPAIATVRPEVAQGNGADKADERPRDAVAPAAETPQAAKPPGTGQVIDKYV